MPPELTPTPQVVRIAVPAPLRSAFDYLSPMGALPAGIRVRVPFGRSSRVGIVLDSTVEPDLPISKLKAITEILDEAPLLGRELLQLLQWSASYYHHPIGEVFSAALPVALRKGQPATRLTQTCWSLTPLARADGLTLVQRAPAQHALLQQLQERDCAIMAGDPLLSSDRNRRAIAGLADKKLVSKEHRPAVTSHTPGDEPLLALNPAQAAAVTAIKQQLDQFSVHLLDGVTGSGKTEVYLQAMAAVCDNGGQTLLLVPEIGLTDQTLQRIRNRVANRVSVIHSGLTEKERLESWLAAASGEAAVVVGTRSALLTPFNNLGLILVDEEHDLSYKQQEGFRYNARDLAVKRAQLNQIPIVLGSATPSIESIHRVNSGRYQQQRLPNRAGGATQPDVRCVDIRNTPLQGGLSEAMITAIERHLAEQHQVLLFLNRRGYAPVYYCHRCGWSTRCEACDATLTYHRVADQLLCHHCGASSSLPQRCGECGASDLQLLGAGTERLEETLMSRFPDHTVVRIDRDMTRNKGALAARLKLVNSGEAQILVGTQMLTKGHHFPNVTLVGVLDADQGLYSTDFRATERLAQLLLQVAGRAGRAQNKGEVLIQTHQPEHPLLKTLFTKGYHSFCTTELATRQAAQLPPFSQLALFRAECRQLSEAENFLTQAATLLRQHAAPELLIMGPFPAPMEKRQGRYRVQLVLQGPEHRDLHQLLSRVLPLLDKLPRRRELRWSLDIDPMDLY